jgi:hypothetical protein
VVTPQNLEDFALRLSPTEDFVSSAAVIRQLEITKHRAGIDLRVAR